MKKRVKSLIVFLFIILITIFIMKLIKKEHEVTYNLKEYSIQEKFYIQGKEHWYDFIIQDKKNNFSYSLNENLSKKKRVIKDIKTYKKNDLVCIIPLYKKEIIENRIYCNLKKKSVSTNYLLETKNKDFQLILKQANKYKIKISSPANKKTTYKKLTVYQKNIQDNYKYIIWNYKGIYILSNKELLYQKILDYDLYDSIMATVVGNYYVLFENNSVNGIENIYYYDLIKNKLHTYKLDDKLAKDSYINGVVDNLIYVADKKIKKQYSINIKKERIEEVGNEEEGYYYYQNEKLKLLSKSDFFMKNRYFDNEKTKDKVLKYNDLRKEYNYFYYLEDNRLYKALDTNKKNPTLLFELEDIKDWKIIDRDILLLKEDSLYLYNEESGLTKIIESNELKYNYKNICNIWKK